MQPDGHYRPKKHFRLEPLLPSSAMLACPPRSYCQEPKTWNLLTTSVNLGSSPGSEGASSVFPCSAFIISGSASLNDKCTSFWLSNGLACLLCCCLLPAAPGPFPIRFRQIKPLPIFFAWGLTVFHQLQSFSVRFNNFQSDWFKHFPSDLSTFEEIVPFSIRFRHVPSDLTIPKKGALGSFLDFLAATLPSVCNGGTWICHFAFRVWLILRQVLIASTWFWRLCFASSCAFWASFSSAAILFAQALRACQGSPDAASQKTSRNTLLPQSLNFEDQNSSNVFEG